MKKIEKYPRDDGEELKGYASYTNLGINQSSQKLDFIISFSTPHLMKKQHTQGYLQADATFRISWNDFPLLLAGFSDANRKFHPTILSIVSRECTSTYTQLFKEIFEFDEENLYIPKHVMGDGTATITKAATEIFGAECIRLMCYFHIIQRIKIKVKE